MSSYDNMTAAMRAVGVYSLNGQSIVDMELMSYAKELDCVTNVIDRTIRESIIMTAADEGLEFYEKAFGSPYSTNTLSERREMLIQKMRLVFLTNMFSLMTLSPLFTSRRSETSRYLRPAPSPPASAASPCQSTSAQASASFQTSKSSS